MEATPGQGRWDGFDPQRLEEHARWLRRLARGLTRDAASAEDLAQDSWVALARTDREVHGLRAWLAGTARRLARGRTQPLRNPSFLTSDWSGSGPDRSVRGWGPP